MFLDPNAIDYRDSWPDIGTIDATRHDPPFIEISGSVSGLVKGTKILVTDASRRFIFAAAHAGDRFALRANDICLSANSWPLCVYLYDDSSNVAFPIGEVALPAGGEGGNAIPSFKENYIQVVIEAMKHRYTSVSSKDGIKTGNGYQSVDLDEIATQGGRPHRDLFFSHIDFKGKTVLDIGANTGELSRLARKRGAALVDGYEYDPFFVETGRMINAATGMTRVSLFQGDATNRDLWEGKKYDIVLTFAVWVYTSHLLDKIAAMTNIVFFETHTIDHGLDMYIEPMSKFFPHFRIIGYDEMRDMRKSRCVLLFAKTADQLEHTLRFQKLVTDPYFDHAYFQRHGRTDPQNFSEHASRVFEAVEKAPPIIQGLGTAYFELFVSGYHVFARDGELTVDNIFVNEFRKAIASGRIDENLKYLVDDEFLLLQKVRSKYKDLTNLLSGKTHLVAPPIIRPGLEGALRFTKTDGERLLAANIDGHHRFFMAQLLGYPTIDVLVREPLVPKKKVVNSMYKIA